MEQGGRSGGGCSGPGSHAGLDTAGLRHGESGQGPASPSLPALAISQALAPGPRACPSPHVPARFMADAVTPLDCALPLHPILVLPLPHRVTLGKLLGLS